MSETGIICLLLIAANIFISYKGFTNKSFFESYSFKIDPILVKKDYIRMISSGFLHVGWVHLLFNMFSLYAFSAALEFYLGPLRFLLVYFISLSGGNLFALYIHR